MAFVKVPVMKPFKAKVTGLRVPRAGGRWRGALLVEFEGAEIAFLMPASMARWFTPGEWVKVLLKQEPEHVGGKVFVAPRDTYSLWRLLPGGEEVLVWPPWSVEESLPRHSPVTGEVIYRYSVMAREAVKEEDFTAIVELEQHHYASREEIVATWRCPSCGKVFEANVQPECPECGVPCKLQEIRGSLPASRFLILELASREPYEPRVVAYVRVDTPIPLMHRRVNGRVERLIRERVLKPDWIHPTFWPEALEKPEALSKYPEIVRHYARVRKGLRGEDVTEEALRVANTAGARIARVVVHPDYRGDGVGALAVKLALRWVAERRIPEMRRGKHFVETIAMMAKYNPFFERVGFKYVWDTASGRPVLIYPLTKEAEELITKYLSEDPKAREHGGRLFRPKYAKVEPIKAPIRLEGVTKVYRSELDVQRLKGELRQVLQAFGVEKRVVEKYIFRDAHLEIRPGEVVAVIGASGAGKTTLLKMLVNAATGAGGEAWAPTEGKVIMPPNARVAYLLPGEAEPSFGNETILEHVNGKVGDVNAAIQILNAVGLSDAIYYRAKYTELSTGQKERAKLASLLAERPNVLIIDEFGSHLDKLTAKRVARKVAQLCREAGITLIATTHRTEVLEALTPDKVVMVGYGTLIVKEGREPLKH